MNQDETFKSLEAAFKANDAGLLTKLLDEHPELKKRINDPLPHHCFGSTPLLAAVGRGSKELVEALLAAGANINGRSDWWAGSFGVLDSDSGLEEFLIERGANVDAHAAARLNKLGRLKELVEENPEAVHARGGDGQTPLHFAATIEIADYLLANGAEIDALDIDHESTPAQYMIRDRQQIARHLVKRGCKTDLLMASALGDLELVKGFLEANPEAIHMSVSEEYFPKKNPKSGGTIYIWTLGQNKTAHVIAREFGREEVYEFLMSRTPEGLKLALACEAGDEKLVRSLLTNQPSLSHSLSEEERNKVVYAAEGNKQTAVKLMLEAGWPIDAKGKHGATALHWAAFHGNSEMIRTLLRFGPPLEARDRDFNGTPMGWALHGSEHGWHAQTGDYAGAVEALAKAGAQIPDGNEGSEKVKAVLKRLA
jgi:ankyrin repeat protein